MYLSCIQLLDGSLTVTPCAGVGSRLPRFEGTAIRAGRIVSRFTFFTLPVIAAATLSSFFLPFASQLSFWCSIERAGADWFFLFEKIE